MKDNVFKDCKGWVKLDFICNFSIGYLETFAKILKHVHLWKTRN